MAGNNSVRGDQTITFTDNLSFDGTERGGALDTDGQLWIGATASNRANNGGHVRKGNLTSSDSSIIITNGAGTINLRSNPSVVPDLHTAKWIVNPTPNAGGNQTTISAAITAASSGDTIFITPGTYTENLTLKAGVDLTAFGCDSSLNGTGHVIINGTSTLTTAGSVTISGIQLQTNGAAFLAVTGSAASVVNLNNCYLNCTNASGITYSSSSTSSGIYIKDCNGNLGTTGIAFITATGAGTAVSSSEGVLIEDCKFTNSGGSTTANTTSACVVRLQRSQFENPFTTSSTGAVSVKHSVIYCGGINTTAITTSGTATNTSFFSTIFGGTQPAISIGSGTTMILCQNDINSSNTNAITGAGTLQYAGNTFDSSSNINVTTQTLIAEGPSRLISSSNSGNTNTLTVSNSSNTATSSANILSSVAGSTAADPTHQASVTGVTTWTWGIDNSVTTPTADPFVIAQGTALGTNNVMSVATSGEINYPLQPSFYAYQPSQASNVTGDGTTYTLGSTVDLTEVFDQNGDFDPRTGILTAPVTGKYQLNGRASIVGGTAITSYSNSIVTSNRSHGLRVDFGAAAVLQNFDLSNSSLCDMDAADTATFVVGTTDSGGKIDDVFGDASSGFTSFSGFLQA